MKKRDFFMGYFYFVKVKYLKFLSQDFGGVDVPAALIYAEVPSLWRECFRLSPKAEIFYTPNGKDYFQMGSVKQIKPETATITYELLRFTYSTHLLIALLNSTTQEVTPWKKK